MSRTVVSGDAHGAGAAWTMEELMVELSPARGRVTLSPESSTKQGSESSRRLVLRFPSSFPSKGLEHDTLSTVTRDPEPSVPRGLSGLFFWCALGGGFSETGVLTLHSFFGDGGSVGDLGFSSQSRAKALPVSSSEKSCDLCHFASIEAPVYGYKRKYHIHE